MRMNESRTETLSIALDTPLRALFGFSSVRFGASSLGLKVWGQGLGCGIGGFELRGSRLGRRVEGFNIRVEGLDAWGLRVAVWGLGVWSLRFRV